ncbi:hypothetical protein NA78x_001163 [Anatilimnocola sp. NA78]|uniref:hypothetical protein n=1 Tax=Anatilimnocola sp. NA78 TaxID=3415683 RepID=UPI003CE571E4
MPVSYSNTIFGLFSSLALLGAIASTGCSSSGPPVVPVKGQVNLVDGDKAALSGHMIELTKADDNLVRSYGQITPEGNFELESLIGGEIHKGALEGKYKARVILSDDDPAQRKVARAAINPRFLKFDSSNLTVDVPATTPVQLQISRR